MSLSRRELLGGLFTTLSLSACGRRDSHPLGDAATAVQEGTNISPYPQILGFELPKGFKFKALVKGIDNRLGINDVGLGGERLNKADQIKIGLYSEAPGLDKNIWRVNDIPKVLGWLPANDIDGDGADRFAKAVLDVAMGGPGTVRSLEIKREQTHFGILHVDYEEEIRNDGILKIDVGGETVYVLQITRTETNLTSRKRGVAESYGETVRYLLEPTGTDANGQPQYVATALIQTVRLPSPDPYNPLQTMTPLKILDHGSPTAAGGPEPLSRRTLLAPPPIAVPAL